ncbi:FecCD family ABC transporter permease [Halioglobus pacificus]|uniref:Heme ABC transporter permease n=1 Tax=Parahalioglobus pacificus TaxID=930806 RepID=A0A918XL29_9GAMM|nr:iron ABC transporter permease [Halioglobus pacificus]GHD35980.1 heme ABC transporter permease [Halioglobus pacificus]
MTPTAETENAERLTPTSKSSEYQRLLWLVSGLAAACLLAISSGALEIPIISAVLGRESLSELQQRVLWDIRLPRVVLAAFVGAALAMTGAALQGLFRNPLAEPQLIGVSGGAALGAVAMIVLSDQLSMPNILRPYALPCAAFAGAAAVTSSLYWFASGRRADQGVGVLLLVGIAINAISSVGIGAFTYLSDDGQLRTLTFWTLGSFGGASWSKALPAIVLIALATAVLGTTARRLDQLQLGEVAAQHAGVDVNQLKRRIVFAGAAAVGAGVAVSGIIGFVGLVVPHLVRLLISVKHRYLLPGCAVFGAALAVLADLGSRTLVSPAELPVGLITSAIGAPFFLWLITRVRR